MTTFTLTKGTYQQLLERYDYLSQEELDMILVHSEVRVIRMSGILYADDEMVMSLDESYGLEIPNAIIDAYQVDNRFIPTVLELSPNEEGIIYTHPILVPKITPWKLYQVEVTVEGEAFPWEEVTQTSSVAAMQEVLQHPGLYGLNVTSVKIVGDF